MRIRTLMHGIDVPEPVLFNVWKHHGRAVRARMDGITDPGELCALTTELVTIGQRLMDFYIGELMPDEIAESIVGYLDRNGVLEPDAFRTWVEANGGYRSIELDEDRSVWIARHAQETGRYVHIHPGRRTPFTVRVRAHTLRTAILTLMFARLNGVESDDLMAINQARSHYLGLDAIPKLDSTEGIGRILAILRAMM